MDDLASAIMGSAQNLGIDPLDLGTAISYETAGTFDPWKAGPTTQWGQHHGLIQWGEPQAKQYGVHQGMPLEKQMAAVEKYLIDRGVRPGMGLMDIYSAINAGRVGLYNRSDAANGGAPGTVADKVNSQMAAHRQRAEALLAGAAQPQTPQPVQVATATPAVGIPAATASREPAQQVNSLADLYVPSAAPKGPTPGQQIAEQAAAEEAARKARLQALFA